MLGQPRTTQRYLRGRDTATSCGRLPEERAASHLAFGHLFLEDVRAYRKGLLADTGFTPVFPAWGSDTATLARTMVAGKVPPGVDPPG